MRFFVLLFLMQPCKVRKGTYVKKRKTFVTIGLDFALFLFMCFWFSWTTSAFYVMTFVSLLCLFVGCYNHEQIFQDLVSLADVSWYDSSLYVKSCLWIRNYCDHRTKPCRILLVTSTQFEKIPLGCAFCSIPVRYCLMWGSTFFF